MRTQVIECKDLLMGVTFKLSRQMEIYCTRKTKESEKGYFKKPKKIKKTEEKKKKILIKIIFFVLFIFLHNKFFKNILFSIKILQF